MELSITPLATLPAATAATTAETGTDAIGGSFSALLAGQLTGLEAFLSAPLPLIDPTIAALLPGAGKKLTDPDSLLRQSEENATNLLAAIPFAPDATFAQVEDAANDPLLGSDTGNSKSNNSDLFALLAHTRAPRAENMANQLPQQAESDIATDTPALSTHSATATHTAGRSHETAAPTPQNAPSITAHLHDNKWSQQLSDRVLWLARGDVQNAQINITPAHLGPIQISLSLNGEQMTAHFVSASQEVRQALEDALPRLREMLAGAGINLGQANVGSQQQQQAQAEQFAAKGENSRQSSDGAILPADQHGIDTASARPIQRGQGLVDLFA
ncbi:hypothetical protein MASR1M42_07040 [Azonexus hydrophilus]